LRHWRLFHNLLKLNLHSMGGEQRLVKDGLASRQINGPTG